MSLSIKAKEAIDAYRKSVECLLYSGAADHNTCSCIFEYSLSTFNELRYIISSLENQLECFENDNKRLEATIDRLKGDIKNNVVNTSDVETELLNDMFK